ncbi:hypothetical protein [Pseudomonas sp. DWRC2-2]|uniref:hypothetical protein n=1 Tax=Pseudomonas sp. DWRC2-2 TaxID=2804567 RepID=UPI003CEC8BFE
MLYVMLSLDLSGAENQRYAFNQQLEVEGFQKLTNVDTVWTTSIEGYDDKEGLVARGFKKFFKDTAVKFEIPKLTYVVQIGNSEALGVLIELRYGAYEIEDFDPTQPAT